MKKRANKSLFGSMMFLAVFLIVFLSTAVYIFVQGLTRNTNLPSSSNTNTNTYTTRTVEPPGIHQTQTKKQKVLKKFRAISRMARMTDSFTKEGAAYSKEFDEIEAGDVILTEIVSAFEAFEDSIFYEETELDVLLEEAENPSKPMKFGFSHKITTTSEGGYIHTLDLTDALGIPGSTGSLQLHTSSEEKIPTDGSFTVEEFCDKEHLIFDYEEDLVLEDGTECHRIYLKEENKFMDLLTISYPDDDDIPYSSMINPNVNSIPIPRELKFACFTAIHPDSSHPPAVLISERISVKTETAENPNFAFHIKNAMGNIGSEALFIGSKAMRLYYENERNMVISKYLGSHFDSIQTYGEFLRINELKYADCDSFKHNIRDYTVHYASRDYETYRQLKGKIEDVVEAIYEGAWAYPGEQVAFRNSVITDILNRDDVAILIVFQKKEESSNEEVDVVVPDFETVLNNYALIGQFTVYQQLSLFGNESSIGLTKVFKILQDGRPAYYFKYLRGAASLEQTKKALLNLTVSNTEFKIINDLRRTSLQGMEETIAKSVTKIMADKSLILDVWRGYLKILTGNFPAFDSLEVIFVE